MAQDALERALARIDRPPAPEAAPSAPPGAPGDWIKVAPDVLRAAQERRRWAAPGVWVANLDLDRATGARTYLLGVGPNIAVPRHGHRGHELICVLKGAYHDGDQLHGPGDFADNDETVEHRPKITRDGECVCLIAADHRLAPRDLMGWIFQPLVGI
jgi:putative transcriptional regulator